MKLKSSIIISSAVVLVLLAVLWLFSRTPKTVYSYTAAGYADIVSTITVSGKLSPEKEVDIKPHIYAYVSDILVHCGDEVKKNQQLFKLEAIPDVFALEEADAAVELETIALKQAQTDFERAEILFAGNSISTKEYELAKNALDVAREHLVLATNRRSIIVNGSSKRSSQYNESVVLSPVDGIVSEIFVNQGESVSPFGPGSLGTAICRIADNGQLVFKGNVDETDISFIHKGMKVSLVLGAFPDTEVQAEIISISSFGRSYSGFTQFEIRASLNSVPQNIELRSGFSANAKIETNRAEHVLSVPEECIRFDKNSMPYVMRLTSAPGNMRRQRWESVPVTLGISNGRIIQVLSGLEENDIVQTVAEKSI